MATQAYARRVQKDYMVEICFARDPGDPVDTSMIKFCSGGDTEDDCKAVIESAARDNAPYGGRRFLFAKYRKGRNAGGDGSCTKYNRGEWTVEQAH